MIIKMAIDFTALKAAATKAITSQNAQNAAVGGTIGMLGGAAGAEKGHRLKGALKGGIAGGAIGHQAVNLADTGMALKSDIAKRIGA